MKNLHSFYALSIVVFFCLRPALAGERLPLALLFDESDIPRIESNLSSAYLARYWKRLQEPDWTAESAFLDSLRPGTGCIGIGRIENILRREAFVYAVTGAPERAERARRAMKKLLEYPRWDVFYDQAGKTLNVDLGTHASMSASYALDWLGDALTVAERSVLAAAIAEKGCEAGFHTLADMRWPEGKTDWRADHYDLDLSRWPYILDKTNIKGLMIGGLGIAALALLDSDPRAQRWLEMAEYSCRRFLELYRPDGFYPEGSGYWEYSSRSVFPFIRALRRKTGRDLAHEANLRGSAETWLAIQMPVGYRRRTNVVNFGDNGREITSSPALFVAQEFRDGLAQWAALNFSRHHDIHTPIFYDRSIQPESPTGSLNYKILGNGEWLVARTGFAPTDIQVAMRSGGPFNHEHADRNSIILKAFGQVLLNDIPHPSYNRHNPSWMLRGSRGHNSILVDGRGLSYHDGSQGTNESADSAFILTEGQRRGYFFWTSDATAGYSRTDPDISSVVRTVVGAFDVPVLLVLDKVEKKRYSSQISALWQVDNENGDGRIAVSGNSFTIFRPGVRLDILSAGSTELATFARTHPIPDEPDQFPYAEVRTAGAATSHLLITVMVPYRDTGKRPRLKIEKAAGPSGSWTVRVENGQRKWKALVHDKGRVPEFEVIRLSN